MDIQQELQDFYNKEATYWHTTRKKYRPEVDHICLYIDKQLASTHKVFSIVELGCGDGRLYGILNDRYGDRISYIGVDQAEKLLAFAEKSYKEARRVCADMESYVETAGQQTVDMCITLASFHHLPSVQARQKVLEGIYTMLVYEGVHISINRAWSPRFRSKYKQAIRQAWWRWFRTAGNRDKRDIYVPFTNPQTQDTDHRYYHMFDIQEFRDLSLVCGFVVEELAYISRQGTMSHSLHDARNMWSIQRKTVLPQP